MNRKTVKHHFSFVCSPLFQLLRAWTQAFFNFPSRFKLSNLTEVLRHHFFNTMQRNSIELQFFYKMTSVKFQKNKNPLMITVIVKKHKNQIVTKYFWALSEQPEYHGQMMIALVSIHVFSIMTNLMCFG